MVGRKKKTSKRAKKVAQPVREVVRRPDPKLARGYAQLLDDIKTRIHAARIKAALAVNRELIQLYWEVGKTIVSRQRFEGWGQSVIERLSADIRAEFPDLTGFSPRNIWRMRAFYVAYTEGVENLTQAASEIPRENLQQLVGQVDGENLPRFAAEIPWFHNIILIEKLKDPIRRLWYACQTIEQGWSRAVLVHQIESDLYARQSKALTNFPRTLPAPQSDLARQLLKDPYHLDFLAVGPEISERQLKRALLEHLKDFLIELGKGFAFVGGEYHLEVGGQDYYLDLLFYNLSLHCYVVIELKVEEFKPEFAGKMNFYLSAIDEQLRQSDIENPSIGVILCKDHNRVIVEYALRESVRPMGVARYEIKTTRRLPRKLKDSLPTPTELKAELKKAAAEEKSA